MEVPVLMWLRQVRAEPRYFHKRLEVMLLAEMEAHGQYTIQWPIPVSYTHLVAEDRTYSAWLLCKVQNG